MAKAATWDTIAHWAEKRLTPTFGAASSASGLALHPRRDCVAASAEVRASLLDPPMAVITSFEAGKAEPIRNGWLPTWSPDGTVLAHADASGVQIGELHRALPGHVERLAWSPDGNKLLVVVAEAGSEFANLVGSGLVPNEADPWTPDVASSCGYLHWRRLLAVDVASGASVTLGRPDLNIWNACWAGDRIVAVCSDGSPTESAWYSADLRLLDLNGGERVLTNPRDQLGALAASASGSRIAFVTSVASDRDLVAGDLHVLDLESGQARTLVGQIDVSDIGFVREDELGFIGLQGLTTVAGFVTVDDDVKVLWSSAESTAAGAHPTASFQQARIAMLRVGHRCLPEVLLLSHGASPRVLATLAGAAAAAGTSTVHRWTAPDGLSLEGWLHLPDAPGPYPLVVALHGGPVASHRATPLGLPAALLLERGWAVLQPNPRGSIGRGQEFARAVVGDMGGADAVDITSSVTSLITAGLVDASRVGVTGGSYGGFLTAWLITQTQLFAAAVAQHPITDWAHQHGVSSIPAWDELFLDGKPYAPDGQYVQRSPLTHAAKASTPTLLIAGALDRATPPGQALAMQRALQVHGVPSQCVTYPLAAHGPRDTSTALDVTARTLAWFERWIPSKECMT